MYKYSTVRFIVAKKEKMKKQSKKRVKWKEKRKPKNDIDTNSVSSHVSLKTNRETHLPVFFFKSHTSVFWQTIAAFQVFLYIFSIRQNYMSILKSLE